MDRPDAEEETFTITPPPLLTILGSSIRDICKFKIMLEHLSGGASVKRRSKRRREKERGGGKRRRRKRRRGKKEKEKEEEGEKGEGERGGGGKKEEKEEEGEKEKGKRRREKRRRVNKRGRMLEPRTFCVVGQNSNSGWCCRYPNLMNWECLRLLRNKL